MELHFGNGDWWWILGSVPLLALLFWVAERRRVARLTAFADLPLQRHLISQLPRLAQRQRHRARQMLIIIFLLSLALLRPQYGYEWEERAQRGVDIAIAIDVSESMLARDIAPSRLERARWEVSDLLSRLKGDRVSLVAFSGIAFIESPLTVDYGTFRSFLKTISPELIPIPGTNIEDALDKSVESLLGKDRRSLPNGGAVLLITDGEAFDGDVSAATRRAKDANIRIYVMGIGTPEGAPIELRGGGYKKDRDGHVIITKFNQSALEQLARDTGGVYVSSITSSDDTTALYEKGIRSQLEEVSLGDVRRKKWNEYYQIPLLLALALWFYGPLLEFMRKRLPKKVLASLLLFLAPNTSRAETAEQIGARAAEAFHGGSFSSALSAFDAGQIVAPEDPRFLLGKGASLYRLQKFEEARAAYQSAAQALTLPSAKAEALYNLANSMVQLNELDEAIKSYEESLKLVPGDKEAQDNLEYAKRLKQQQSSSSSSSSSSASQNSSEQSSSEQSSSPQSSSSHSSSSHSSSSSESSSQQQSSSESNSSQSSSPSSSAESSSDSTSSENSQSSASSSDASSESSSQGSSDSSNSDSSGDSSHSAQNSAGSSSDSSQGRSQIGSPESNSSDSTSQGGETASSEAASDPQKDEQIEALLGNIEEDRDALAEHRRKVAKGELERAHRALPEKDW